MTCRAAVQGASHGYSFLGSYAPGRDAHRLARQAGLLQQRHHLPPLLMHELDERCCWTWPRGGLVGRGDCVETKRDGGNAWGGRQSSSSSAVAARKKPWTTRIPRRHGLYKWTCVVGGVEDCVCVHLGCGNVQAKGISERRRKGDCCLACFFFLRIILRE